MPTHTTTLRINRELIEKLDEVVKLNCPKYSNRNHLIMTIINDFLQGQKSKSIGLKIMPNRFVPDEFPIKSWFAEMVEFANYMPDDFSWEAISQPDGFIYFHINLFSHLIEKLMSEAGLTTEALASEDKIARACHLRAYYDIIRDYGGGHPWVGPSYYSGSFTVTNIRSGDTHKFRLIPVAAAALGADPKDLENSRLRIPTLRSIEISYGWQRF